MSLSTAAPDPETLHPSLWRASQLARSHTRCVDTGHPSLSKQLPGGGWPVGTLVDLLVQQPGVGELRMLAPALKAVSKRKIVLLQPPHAPNALAMAGLGLAPDAVLWLRAERSADSIWAAEQVLRSNSCGALLFWANHSSASGPRQHIRNESLRRLHLAAQQSETLFFMMRDMYSGHDAAPAPLRLSIRPAPGGVDIGFVKRQGPQRDEPLFLPMSVGITRRIQPNEEPQQPVVAPAVARSRSVEIAR